MKVRTAGDHRRSAGVSPAVAGASRSRTSQVLTALERGALKSKNVLIRNNHCGGEAAAALSIFFSNPAEANSFTEIPSRAMGTAQMLRLE